MLKTTHWIGLLLLASLSGGCAHLYDSMDQHMMEIKCCHEAKMAWRRCRDLYAEVCYPFDFGLGFRQGYEGVCMGGDGCPPAMPPRTYWSHHYQNDEGRAQVVAWYDGFHHGVLAAQCDGCEGRCAIPCAQDLYGHKSCEADYSEIEHHVVPEDEMPGYAPEFSPHEMHWETPPGPSAPEHAPYAPEAYDVHLDASPTVAPAVEQSLNQGIDATGAPSF